MNELISVIMPVYNGDKYLEEAIESILNQTFKNFEFIIINDGSKDGSLEIIQKYASLDERIIVVSRENKGLIATLNEGIDIAKGKYLARMDQDDISLAERFEEQINFMEKNLEIGVCGSWIEVFGEDRKTSIWKITYNDLDLRVRLLFSVPFAHPSVMMRKQLINKCGLRYKEQYKNAEDYKFWLDFSKCTKFWNIQKPLLKYRYLETSVSRVADNAKHDERYKIISSIFCDVLNELGVVNSEDENKLHFIIGFNERIAKVDLDLKVLDSYLNKIIKANKITKVFDEKYLECFLSKKFLIVCYYNFRKNFFIILKVIIYKFFWYSIFNSILGRYKFA